MLLLLILNSDAKVHKGLGIAKQILVFNMKLTLEWRILQKKNRECSRIPYFIILTILKPINQKPMKKNQLFFAEYLN